MIGGWPRAAEEARVGSSSCGMPAVGSATPPGERATRSGSSIRCPFHQSSVIGISQSAGTFALAFYSGVSRQISAVSPHVRPPISRHALNVEVVGSHPPLSAKQKYLDEWYHTPMSAYQTDSRIDEYIHTLPGWQQEMCRQVRELVHAADPDVTETIKRTKQPYFTLNGNICALLGAKDHLTIFIYDPIVPDPESIINQGQGNLAARAWIA